MKTEIYWLLAIIVIMALIGLGFIIATRNYTSGFEEGYEFGKRARDEDNNKPH